MIRKNGLIAQEKTDHNGEKNRQNEQ